MIWESISIEEFLANILLLPFLILIAYGIFLLLCTSDNKTPEQRRMERYKDAIKSGKKKLEGNITCKKCGWVGYDKELLYGNWSSTPPGCPICWAWIYTDYYYVVRMSGMNKSQDGWNPNG